MLVLRSPAEAWNQPAHYSDPSKGANQAGRLTERGRGTSAITLPFLLLLAGCFTLVGCFSSVEATTREEKDELRSPNIILILTDDLAVEDLNEDTLEHMPNVGALMDES